MISAQDVAQLRLQTGAGVIACKKALEDAGGDFQKAKEILAASAEAMAKKKSEREAKQGIIDCYLHNGKIGVLLELSCESDFVAKNTEFKDLAHHLAMQIASMNPQDVAELLGEVYIKDEAMTIKNLIDQAIQKIGENIQVKRFIRYELGEEN